MKEPSKLIEKHREAGLSSAIRTSIIALVLAAAPLSCTARRPLETDGLPTSEPRVVTSFDHTVRDLLEQFNIPGAAICVIDDGQVIHKQVYGVADTQSGEPVTSATRFQVASVSKLFTAWAAMSLVDSGDIQLDAPIEDFTGNYRLPSSDFDARQVTAERLLAHTAGTSAWGFLGDPWTDEPLPSTRAYLERGAEDGGPLVILEAEPGSRHRYSGGGYTLLQLAVEEASGTTFADFVERSVFEPLGMNDAGFNGRRGLERYSVGHDALGGPLPDDRFPALAAAGAFASLDDLIQFAEIHWNGADTPVGNDVLSPESFETMFRPAPASGGTWALGYEVIPGGEEDTPQLFGHTGDNPGYHSLIFVHPRDRDAFIILTNGDAGSVFRNQLLAPWCELTGHRERFGPRSLPVGPTLLGVAARGGAEAVIKEYRHRQAAEHDAYRFDPRQLDRLAGYLLDANRPEDALLILEFNVEEFPESTIALGSLAERCMELRRFDAAERLCRRILELEQDHERAQCWLEEIQAHSTGT